MALRSGLRQSMPILLSAVHPAIPAVYLVSLTFVGSPASSPVPTTGVIHTSCTERSFLSGCARKASNLPSGDHATERKYTGVFVSGKSAPSLSRTTRTSLTHGKLPFSCLTYATRASSGENLGSVAAEFPTRITKSPVATETICRRRSCCASIVVYASRLPSADSPSDQGPLPRSGTGRVNFRSEPPETGSTFMFRVGIVYSLYA